MGIGSIFTGIAAFILMIGGVLLALVPFLGVSMSLGAPILAIVGIVLGGLGMSRAKRDGESSGAAVAGLTINIIAFLMGVFFALTCGLCGAAVSNAYVNGDYHLQRPTNSRFAPSQFNLDAGTGMQPLPPVQPSTPPSALPPDPSSAVPSGSPPPAMPPPPLGAGAPSAPAPAPESP